ncbi:putative sieve element occlusion [Helianthus annuus]|nr:putative sieve element occlusion [Helianthus annuus]
MAKNLKSSLSTLSARVDKNVFPSSDDDAMKKTIITTHSPDHGTNIDVLPLLQIIKDIMNIAYPEGPQAKKTTTAESVFNYDSSEMFEVLAPKINKVACEISCKCTGGGDKDATAIGILKTLSNYGWDAKAAITLAAFAVNYGEFWLVAQLYKINPLANSLGLLKQVPNILGQYESHKPWFDDVTNLVQTTLEVTHIIIELQKLSERYISLNALFMTIVPRTRVAIYWIIRSIVACASVLTTLIGMVDEHFTASTEALELSSLTIKIKSIHVYLKEKLEECKRRIREIKLIQEYQELIDIMNATHLDNIKPLQHLISLKEDQTPLYESSTKIRVSIEILRKKTVLLLISDLYLPSEGFCILEKIYKEAKQNPTKPENQYEVVWLPVVPDLTEDKKNKFEGIRNNMPWYSLFHPSLLRPAVIKYIKEKWHFNCKPLLVVMDPQGSIVNTNALHMLLLWGSGAFPFTSQKEEALWRDQKTWRVDLLVDVHCIEPKISDWIAKGKYICLYGGDDINWIQRFRTVVQAFVKQAGIELEMLYVGKSNPGNKIITINNDIIQKHGDVLLDLARIRAFWVRLETMFHSKLQSAKSLIDDQLLKEINVMLTYDGSGKGWAVISRGSNDWMNRVDGDTVLKCLNTYGQWKGKAGKDLLPALNDQIEANKPPHHCNRVILPGTGSVPEIVICADCGKSMEKYILYRCCTD